MRDNSTFIFPNEAAMAFARSKDALERLKLLYVFCASLSMPFRAENAQAQIRNKDAPYDLTPLDVLLASIADLIEGKTPRLFTLPKDPKRRTRTTHEMKIMGAISGAVAVLRKEFNLTPKRANERVARALEAIRRERIRHGVEITGLPQTDSAVGSLCKKVNSDKKLSLARSERDFLSSIRYKSEQRALSAVLGRSELWERHFNYRG